MSRRYDCADAGDRATGLREAASAIRRGEVVVMPTDTVYGIAADAFNADAVAGLFAAKGRGRHMPSPVLIGSPTTLHGLVTDFSEKAWELVDAFWPGGLTLVARHQPSLRWDLGETRGTVAVRMPLHPVAIELLNTTGPLAVSSANKSGQPAPPTARTPSTSWATRWRSTWTAAGPSTGRPPRSSTSPGRPRCCCGPVRSAWSS